MRHSQKHFVPLKSAFIQEMKGGLESYEFIDEFERHLLSMKAVEKGAEDNSNKSKVEDSSDQAISLT